MEKGHNPEAVALPSSGLRLRVLVSGGRSSGSEMVKGRTGQRVRLYVRGTILGYKR